MSDDHDRHLASFHERWNTPEHIVLDAIREVTRAPVVSRRRIVHGAANEVYDFAFENAPSLIVRIARDAEKNMEPERWAIAQCEAHGVEAPHIHRIRHLTLDGAALHICVMTKIEGERLCDAALSSEQTRRVMNQLGAWLSRLHAIPVSGFSYLDGEGRAAAPNYDRAADEFLAVVPEFEAAGTAAGLAPRVLERWISFCETTLRASRPDPVLAHNDLLAKHVLVKDGKLAGVIDFGEVSGEPALNEFAKWDFVEGRRFPVEWIRESYANQALFVPGNDALYRALWLMNGLYLLRWYDMSNYAAGLHRVRERLLGHLEFVAQSSYVGHQGA